VVGQYLLVGGILSLKTTRAKWISPPVSTGQLSAKGAPVVTPLFQLRCVFVSPLVLGVALNLADQVVLHSVDNWAPTASELTLLAIWKWLTLDTP